MLCSYEQIPKLACCVQVLAAKFFNYNQVVAYFSFWTTLAMYFVHYGFGFGDDPRHAQEVLKAWYSRVTPSSAQGIMQCWRSKQGLLASKKCISTLCTTLSVFVLNYLLKCSFRARAIVQQVAAYMQLTQVQSSSIPYPYPYPQHYHEWFLSQSQEEALRTTRCGPKTIEKFLK